MEGNERRVLDFWDLQLTTTKTKKHNKKSKWLSEEALQIAVKRRKAKRKGKIYPFECRVPKNSKE